MTGFKALGYSKNYADQPAKCQQFTASSGKSTELNTPRPRQSARAGDLLAIYILGNKRLAAAVRLCFGRAGSERLIGDARQRGLKCSI